MSQRTYRAFQALILIALGVFFVNTVWTGTLFWYINQRFVGLVLLAGIGFLALAQATLQGARRNGEDGERHTHPPGLSGWTLLLVALPVILGTVIPARPLGATAIANKGINITTPLSAGSGQAERLGLASTDRTVLDWVRAFNYEADPAVFSGQPADVVGFVYHDTRLEADQFLVSRFAVSCCVADALALGMIVTSPEAASLRDNSWVRVRGPVQAARLDGRPIPLIAAESIEQVVEPEQPYLYP